MGVERSIRGLVNQSHRAKVWRIKDVSQGRRVLYRPGPRRLYCRLRLEHHRRTVRDTSISGLVLTNLKK